MHGWQKSVVAAAVVGAAGLGLALHGSASEDQRMTLVARSTAPDGNGFGFRVRATAVEGLYPGAEKRLMLTLDNPYAFDLLVTGLHARVVSTSNPGCEPVDTNLELRPFTGNLPMRVRSRDTRDAGTVPLHMPNSVDNDCQRATFSIAVTADATRATR